MFCHSCLLNHLLGLIEEYLAGGTEHGSVPPALPVDPVAQFATSVPHVHADPAAGNGTTSEMYVDPGPLPIPTSEASAMHMLVQCIQATVFHSVNAAMKQIGTVLEKQTEIVNQLAPLANIVPASSPTKRAQMDAGSCPDPGYDGEQDDDDYDDAPISPSKPRKERDNVFHVSRTSMVVLHRELIICRTGFEFTYAVRVFCPRRMGH